MGRLLSCSSSWWQRWMSSNWKNSRLFIVIAAPEKRRAQLDAAEQQHKLAADERRRRRDETEREARNMASGATARCPRCITANCLEKFERISGEQEKRNCTKSTEGANEALTLDRSVALVIVVIAKNVH